MPVLWNVLECSGPRERMLLGGCWDFGSLLPKAEMSTWKVKCCVRFQWEFRAGMQEAVCVWPRLAGGGCGFQVHGAAGSSQQWVDQSGGGDRGLWSQTVWAQILAASLPPFVMLGRLINVSVPQFPCLQTGIAVTPVSSDCCQD